MKSTYRFNDLTMRAFVIILLFIPIFMFGQEPVVQDSTDVQYIIIEGDSIPRTAINLDEVIVMPKLHFKNKDERIRYLILKRKTLKVYPYAKLAAERLTTLRDRLATLERKRQKKKEFSDKA